MILNAERILVGRDGDLCCCLFKKDNGYLGSTKEKKVTGCFDYLILKEVSFSTDLVKDAVLK